jgi:hypothetical protein
MLARLRGLQRCLVPLVALHSVRRASTAVGGGSSSSVVADNNLLTLLRAGLKRSLSKDQANSVVAALASADPTSVRTVLAQGKIK